MRYSAVATDPMDFTRALRMEFGLEPEMEAGEFVMVAAVANLGGDVLMEFASIVAEAGDPGVVMALDMPHKLDEPARMLVLLPGDEGLAFESGLTLWAGQDPSTPLLLVSANGTRTYAITDRGLLRMPSPPRGIEATLAPGIARACDRLSDRMLAIGKLRDLAPMAA